MSEIILSTINARYIHSALGLRYLYANLGELQDRSEIIEYTTKKNPLDIAENLLANEPKIIALGVYIWNAEPMLQLVQILKQIAPQICIILGGPEVSYETGEQEICGLVDHVILGQADLTLAPVCRGILRGDPPQQKIIQAEPVPLDAVKLPYSYYTDEDVAHRLVYVEASRGCPFKCEFCLSALDKTASPFPLDEFLSEMDRLIHRGARHFKFVDRTFNLKVATSVRILTFFLRRLANTPLFLHFEIIPDRLPDPLKDLLSRFPANSLQFEIGVQSFNPVVQNLISRRQDNQQTELNLRWIRKNTVAHIHADLIFGLPAEDLNSFAAGFDQLWKLNPHEIQLGILKRLRGTVISRHNQVYDMQYLPTPPYTVLSTSEIDFNTMQRVSRMARFWDLTANSGKFTRSLRLLLAEQPFFNFLRFSDWLYAELEQPHSIALKRLYAAVYTALITVFEIDQERAALAIRQDFADAGIKDSLKFLNETSRPALKSAGQALTPGLNRRQHQHTPAQ